jgi:co-chaperonin GroES (HSP10)
MIRPLSNKVLLEKLPPADESAKGIFVYVDRNPPQVQAKVLGIGPKVTDVEVGNIVLIDSKYFGKGVVEAIVLDSQIIAIIG